MTNPVTPNIGLNKIDRTSPATTYFDLEKYIDQNADTVDRFAGEASQAIDALQQRLDTEARREVVLQPGLQIVNAERSAPFSLSGIKGRTLVNLLGRIGRFSSLDHIASSGNHSVSLDSTNKTIGDNGLKVVSLGKGNAGDASNLIRIGSHTYKDNAKYIIIADIKANTPFTLHCELWGGLGSVREAEIGTSWNSVVFRGIGDSRGLGLHFWNLSDKEVTFYLSGLRIYEVTEADYSEPDEKLIQKYPYVDSIQPVRNPYAILYGENLFPPFYHFQPSYGSSSFVVSSAYEATLSHNEVGSGWCVAQSAIPGQVYNLSYQSSNTDFAYINIQWIDAYGESLGWTPKNENGQTVIAPDRAVTMKILVTQDSPTGGTFTFKNPMLTIGHNSKVFKMREDSLLAFQVDLYAWPVNGENADEMFESGGMYYKLSKWKRLVFDSTHQYSYFNSYKEGKCVRLLTDLIDRNKDVYPLVTKFDGSFLTDGLPSQEVNKFSRSDWKVGTGLGISIPNYESGWGENYIPTPEEINAFFMGWRMFDGTESGDPFNGIGKKYWKPINGFRDPRILPTVELPVTQAPTWTPYQLVYQLATSTVEPIVFEGMLRLNERDNLIEVGTGIVLREPTYANHISEGLSYINAEYPFKSKPYDIKWVYKNNQPDPLWKIGYRPTTDNFYPSNGRVFAYIPTNQVEMTSSYSATYLTLDKSPVVPFVGSYAVNEKSVLHELSDAVQQNTSAVSVLMNKKADKGTPTPYLIKPTLLNGWQDYLDGYHPVRYYKDSSGIVYLTGLVKGGAVISHMFKLIDGYRPNSTVIFPTHASTNSTIRIDIFKDGHVYFNYQGQWESTSWVSLDGISFLAEQ